MSLIEPIYILDLRGLVYHSLLSGEDPDAVLRDGKAVNTLVYGVDNFIKSYLAPIFKDYAPVNIIAVHDRKSAFRLDLYPDYKNKRNKARAAAPETQKHLTDVLNVVSNMLKFLGCTQVLCPDVEADDIIAHLCQKLHGPKTVITVDQDLLALNAEDVQVQIRRDNIPTDFNGMEFKYITLYKSIVGDPSDEYGGVPDVGDKSFWAMVDEFGWDGMEELEDCVRTQNYQMLEECKDAGSEKPYKILNKLWNAREEWRLCYRLAELHPELCEGVEGNTLKALQWTKRLPDRDNLDKLLTAVHLQRYSVGNHFGGLMPEFTLIEGHSSGYLQELKHEIDQSPVIAFDYETYDPLKHPEFQQASSKGEYVDVISSVITGASFAVGKNLAKVYYISTHHADTENLPSSVIKNLLTYVRKKGIPLIAHNCSFENEISYLNLGIPLATTYDTRLFSHHLDENTPNGLKALSKRYLEHEQETYKNTLAGRADMSELTGNQVLSYGCDDSLCTAHLAVLFQFMTQCEGSYDFIMQHETPATLPIMDAFLTGVPVDLAKNSELQILDGETVTEKMKVIRQSLAQHVVDQSESAALEVWNHDNNFLTDKLLKQGKTIDEVNEKLSDWKQKLISATKYRELVYVTKQKKLTPGYGLYNKVHKALGGTHKLKDLSSASISAFLVQITEPVSPHLNDFYNCFRGNGPTHVRTKKGANFAALMSLCEAVMSSPGAEDQETMGDELNMNSPNQMLELLYCKLRIPIRVKSKVTRGSQREILGHEGGPGTDEKAMRMAIAEDCPKGDWRREVLEDVLTVKACLTRESLYYSKIPLWVHPKDNKVHPFINSCSTVTRRPTGSAPNLLQVTKKDGGGVRSIYESQGSDHVIVSIDFNGQELRILASECKDPILLDAYVGENKKDIHSVTASSFAQSYMQMHHQDIGTIDYDRFMALREDEEYGKAMKDIRDVAKVLNFLTIYGGGPHTLARNLGIPVSIAKGYIDAMLDRYGRITPWTYEVVQFAQQHGYVQTVYGSRRHCFPGILSSDNAIAARWARQVANFQIQGCIQKGSRVLTRNGLIPIEELVGQECEVWTGFKWAKATGLDRGKCQLARIELSSGLIVNCDTRHKLKDQYGEWTEFKDLVPGSTIQRSVFDTEFNPKIKSKASMMFTLGFWVGDGCMREYTHKQGHKGVDFRISVVKERKVAVLDSIHDLFNREGIPHIYRRSRLPSYNGKHSTEVSVGTKEGFKQLQALGFYKSKSNDRRVPDCVWTSSVKCRQEFLRGFIASDGSRRSSRPNYVTFASPNYHLLHDVLILANSVGVNGMLSRYADGTYYLSLYLKGRRHKTGVIIDEIKAISTLLAKETTYTMSVDDPLHQFVADGTVHKNTAADILKVVLSTAYSEKIFKETGSTLLAGIYDEITSSVPKASLIEYVRRMSRCMTVTPPGHAVPMLPEVSIGRHNWGHLTELGANPTESEITEVMEDRPEEEVS